MNKNKTAIFLMVLCLIFSCVMYTGFRPFKNKQPVISTVKPMQKQTENINNIWCITFQLVWNECIDFFKLDKIEFEGGTPELANELNKKLYTKDDISPDSYYLAYGKVSKSLKNKIEKDIYNKFKEKSDILDIFDWSNKDGYFFYSMLKKDFNFLTQFDILEADAFNSIGKVKYFGINDSSKRKELSKNVRVLFYNNENEYAISLNTKENENVILFRTDKMDSFENLYAYVNENIKFDKFNKKDTLKVPFINVDKTITYNELCNKVIKGTNYYISQAVQTIKFKMDNKGGSLKSEAGIGIRMTSLAPEPVIPRHFDFDKKFVLFLKESGKDKPYYSMIVEDDSFLVKE